MLTQVIYKINGAIEIWHLKKIKGCMLDMEKDKKAKCIMGFMSWGMILGSVLSLITDNIYYFTIFTGIGSGIGLVYVHIKTKK